MDRLFVAENTKERERLASLVENLTDEELSLPLGDDWTIAVALAHLSFWDQRSLFLMRKWKNSEHTQKIIYCSIYKDIIN